MHKGELNNVNPPRFQTEPSLGPYLSIDETSLSNGELYTIVTNKKAHGGKGCIVAIVKGVKSKDVISVLEKIPEEQLQTVKEVTLDLSDSMRKIVRRCFSCAIRVIDRFHVQKLACDAAQEIRVGHRWEAIQADTDAREEAKGRVSSKCRSILSCNFESIYPFGHEISR